MTDYKLPSDGPFKPGTTYNDQDSAIDYFTYPFFVGSIASGGQIPVSVNVQAQAMFEWVKTTCFGFVSGSSEPISSSIIIPVTVQVNDSGSNRNLFFAPVPINTVAGDGREPYILPTSRFFQPLATITVTFTNFSPNTDVYNDVYFVMHGVNHYDLQNIGISSGTRPAGNRSTDHFGGRGS
jgi:hypothetical protein